MFLSSSRIFNTFGSMLRLVAFPQRPTVAVELSTQSSATRAPEIVHSVVPETPSASTEDSPVAIEESSIEAWVDQLFHQACQSYPTYEVMMNKEFAASVRRVFGDDEQGSEGAIKAFAYAREEFYYLSPEEERRLDEENASDGICRHGLDSMTCPCGCFEYD